MLTFWKIHNIKFFLIKPLSPKNPLLFQFSDYDKSVEGIGGKGMRLDRTNEAEMEQVLQQAMDDSRKGTSVLVNVLIGKTDFREGSISV